MKRAYYSESIPNFLLQSRDEILGVLAQANSFPLETSQRNAWLAEIDLLKSVLVGYEGAIIFEYSIPRMGARIDVVLIIDAVIFVLEFKVGEKEFSSNAQDQVMDYALDLKNFHEPSHHRFIAPVLISTMADNTIPVIACTPQNDKVLFPIKTNSEILLAVLKNVLEFSDSGQIEIEEWKSGRYCPTPSIIEAALALYRDHSVQDILKNDAENINLTKTSKAVLSVISEMKVKSEKAICFVTGVPGAGKTLVGLHVANEHRNKDDKLHSVFLSGNGPLVDILQEALARDAVKRDKLAGKKTKKGEALRAVKKMVQNVHHFRDDCLVDMTAPPFEHVTLFDEAQRAWNQQQTSNFMRRKKGKDGFDQSEPEFLISCLDRHKDWAVIVCLVGGGQEINTGEAGISEWVDSLNRSFPDWKVYISPELMDAEYGAGDALQKIKERKEVYYRNELHLAVSMRSFRAEHVSELIKHLLDINIEQAQHFFNCVKEKYPIVITREVSKAKEWLKSKARGTERYGIVVSSQAQRLKPYAIDVKSPINYVHWFLDGKDDVRSSYYLEDVATEFHVQGLELDWACVTWDGDFRFSKQGWIHKAFKGSKWQNIKKVESQQYQKNAYRVLLTRARQGMVIVVPDGAADDPTRDPKFYNPTFEYLKKIGFEII